MGQWDAVTQALDMFNISFTDPKMGQMFKGFKTMNAASILSNYGKTL